MQSIRSGDARRTNHWRRLPALVALAALVSLWTGCAEPPRIDASNDEALQASLDRVTAHMTPDEKRRFFQHAAQFIAPMNIKDQPRPDRVASSLAPRYKELDGLTAEQVLAKQPTAEP